MPVKQMFSRVARQTPVLARGMATVAKTSRSTIGSIAMAAAAGAAAAATLGLTAQAESTMDVLKGISGQLSSIEEAVGKCFDACHPVPCGQIVWPKTYFVAREHDASNVII